MSATQWNARLPRILWDIPRILTRRASPALFAVTMGTGGISGLFESFPYAHGSKPMIILCFIVFFLNLFLFVLFSVFSITKYACYPDKWLALIRKPVISLYIGCFPMGATTLINVAVQVIHARYNFGGKSFLYFIWAVWWLDLAISLLCCWVGVHVMITRQAHTLNSMTAMWMLPVVTLIVAASSGGVVAQALQKYSTRHALQTVAVSAFMVTIGLSLALMILTIYLLRLVVHGLPPGATILSVFLPLGPTGQSGYAVLLIGQNLSTLFPQGIDQFQDSSSNSVGAVVNILCVCVAFVLWSLATMWFFYALLAIQTRLRESLITFSISFWGLVFPNCVYANLTIQLSTVFDSRALRIWGAFYAVATFILWLSILFRSIWELRVFFAIHEHPEKSVVIERPQSAETTITSLA